MSKGNSGLFNGTKGANRINGVNPNVQKEKAFDYAKSIFENGTKLEKAKLNTVSVVYDEENDKYYYGMNRGIELHHSSKNAILFGDDKHQGILPTTSFNNYPVGNCAEVDAINNALNAGAKLHNLHLTTLDVKRKNITSHNIVGKCACENCTYAFKGKVKTNNTKWKE